MELEDPVARTDSAEHLPETEATRGVDAVPSLGDYSGIIAARSTMTTGKDIESGDVYTKMSDDEITDPATAYRCYAAIAMVFFFPVGAVAFCKSLASASKTKQGDYERAHHYSQQALLFSRISCITGVLFWAYFSYSYFAGPDAPFAMEIPATEEWWPELEENVREYFTSDAEA